MFTRRRLIALSVAQVLAPSLLGHEARAQTSATGFPKKPVRVIVPVAAGGPTDIVARMLAEKLSRMWGQEVFIENKGGRRHKYRQRVRRALRARWIHRAVRHRLAGGEYQPLSFAEL